MQLMVLNWAAKDRVLSMVTLTNVDKSRTNENKQNRQVWN